MDPIKKEEKGSDEAQKDVQEEVTAKVEESVDQLEALKEAIASKVIEIEELQAINLQLEEKFQAERQELNSKISELEANLSESAKGLEEAEKGKELAESELARIREEALLESRLSELASKGLLLTSEEAKERQISKVRAMEDEDFISYVAELAEIKGISTPDTADKEEDPVVTEKPNLDADQELASKIQALMGEDVSEEVKDNLKKIISTLTVESSDQPKAELVDNQEVASVAKPGMPELTKVFTGIMKINKE